MLPSKQCNDAETKIFSPYIFRPVIDINHYIQGHCGLDYIFFKKNVDIYSMIFIKTCLLRNISLQP